MINFLSSFSVINSGALIALLSLIIPVLIHIFNRSRGKIVLIGHIELIKQAKKLRVTELKITQWILLLIRLLIFTLIALIIANLVKQGKVEFLNEKHVYLSPAWLEYATNKDINRLQKEHPNDKIFLLSENFQEVTIEAISQHREMIEKKQIVNFEAYLREIESLNQRPEKTIVYLTNQLSTFNEVRRNLSGNYEWRVKKLPGLAVENLLKQSSMTVKVIYDKSRIVDKDYIKLAFDRLVQEKKLSIHAEYIALGNDNDSEYSEQLLQKQIGSTQVDWIIKLGEKYDSPLINQFVNSGSYLIEDLNVESKSDSSSIRKYLSLVKLEQILVTFYHSNNEEQNKIPGEPLWLDSQGNKLLSVTQLKSGKRFYFSSRFHHQWTNLVEKLEFSEVLHNLLISRYDLLGEHQIYHSEAELSFGEPSEERLIMLNQWLLLLLSLLWFLERFITESIIHQKRERRGE